MAIKWHSREVFAVNDKPYATLKQKVNIEDHLRDPGEPGVVAEFIGTDNFSSEWYSRQQYEVDAGRDEEPILYRPIYQEIVNSNFSRHVPVYSLGPAGVVFERLEEGGEVKFMSVGGSSRTAEIIGWGVGLEYTKELVMFNEMWRMGPVERQVGNAHNALLNHLHFSPILSATYTSANQTAGSSTASSASELLDEYIITLEDAIVASQEDSDNPRRGPYTLLIAPGQQFKVSNALKRRLQDGINEQSDAVQAIQNIIVYGGWTGTRGGKATTYSGVTSGVAYLISGQYKMQDFNSLVKQPLEMAMGNADVSRRILEQMVYDVYLGVYANPLRAVEEITWPTLAE